MKKMLVAAAAVCAAACWFTACDLTGGTGEDAQYQALNDMLRADYSRVVLTVTDTFGEDSLESVYTITYTEEGANVQYTVERFSEIVLGETAAEKVTLTGTAVIEGGEVVSMQGDDVGLSASVAKQGFTFKQAYFEDAQLTGMTFKAGVKDPSGFLGAELVCTGMRVEALFLDCFYEITLSYTAEGGSDVRIAYAFEL